MPDYNPCKRCKCAPKVFHLGLMWEVAHCGELVEAFSEAEAAAKWNRLNPVEVTYANTQTKEAK